MKFIKQIAAVGTGIAMLGATMTGALAADLGTLPEPFVASDAYVNVAMVIGAGSADADARSTIQTYMDGLATATTVSGGESYLIETGTNKMNIGDNLTEVKTINFDHDELPSVLASGEFSNGENTEFSYEQKIALSDALEFAYFADNNYESKDPTLGVKIDKNSHILNYTFNFIEPAEDDTNSGNDFLDFEDVDISFLGKTYSVVDAKNSTSYDLELTLMGGHEKDTISIGETKSYTVSGTTYDVELTFVDADECQFAVSYDSGTETTNKLSDGSTDELDDGTVVGVTEVNYMVGATMEILSCEFYLGADKIELKDTQEVKINDEDVDKLKFYVDHTSGNPFKINSWTLEWKADEDMFVTADSSITMPGFESIMISSEGLVTTETYEVVKFRGSS